MTRHMAKPLLLPLFSSLLLASGPALSQPNLPDKASATAHQKVLENAHPAVMAEVERMKAEQKARSDQSLSSFPSASQGNSGISVFVPPSTPVIVAVETEDGELVATEF